MYYRIYFLDDKKYLAYAHGDFYKTHIKSFGRLFTDETINHKYVIQYLNQCNQEYIKEDVDNNEKIHKGFIY